MPRPARAETEQTERRRRRDDTLDRVHGLKLAVPGHLTAPGGACDPAQWVTRWVNDKDARVYDLTVSDDWEPVPTDDQGAQRRVPVGQNPDGTPLYAVLCRKPLEFAQEDAAKREERIKQTEAGIIRDATPAPEDTRSPETAYVAKGTTIKRGPYVP